jgi:hypothetical protein
VVGDRTGCGGSGSRCGDMEKAAALIAAAGGLLWDYLFSLY